MYFISEPYLDELKWHCPVCVSKLHDQVRSLMSRNLELEDQQWKLISDNLQYHQKRSQMLEERLKTSQREIAAFQSEVQVQIILLSSMRTTTRLGQMS